MSYLRSVGHVLATPVPPRTVPATLAVGGLTLAGVLLWTLPAAWNVLHP